VVHTDRGALDVHARQVVAAAALLADAATMVVAVVFGELEEDLAPLGADKVIVLPTQSWHPERELACLRAVIERFEPRHVLFPDNLAGGGDLGRRLAATCGDAVPHVAELTAKEVGVLRHAGKLLARRDPSTVLLLEPGIVDPELPFLGRAEHVELSFPLAAKGKIQDLGLRAVPSADLSLEEADFIIAAGNGVDDVPTFQALAEAFGAAVGASRVAVDDGKFPRSKQIGATGKTVSASVYIAIGISGAIQHLQGIKACRHVIAINNDAGAPISRRANLTVVADAQDVILHLLREINDPRRNSLEAFQ
jgi:electron transfer flavoprotein alpha subunit